jgi:hypothetical protein
MGLTVFENNGMLPLPAGIEATAGWYPRNAPQYTFINCRAQIALFGGQSGGGKTNVLVADSAQEWQNPNFRGVIIRESFQEMQNIMDEMDTIYRPLGARHTDGKKFWRFPAGGQMRLGYMAVDDDIKKFTGKPISFLGIDEAQFQTEARIRKILPWVATPPSYGLRDRVRMTANPSTPWLKKLFLNNECPVCHPERSTIPAAIYAGARWNEDDDFVMMTTAFIPAKLSENPLYDEQKKAALMSQTADVRRKLLDGCWCHTEGAFLPFLNESYYRPYSEADEQWWHTHFLSMDYGYSSSAAATGLYSVNEQGTIFKIMEDSQRKMYSQEYAHHIAQKMILRKIGSPEQRCRIVSAYADSAMDQHNGATGRSNLEIINEVMSQHGVHFIKGAKAPQASAQLLAGKLKRREYVITRACPKTWECWTTRKADPNKSGEVLKVPGDELDDQKDVDLYALNNFCQGTKKPAEVATAEKIAELEKQGVDQRSISVTRYRLEQSAAKLSEPARMGRATVGNYRRGR